MEKAKLSKFDFMVAVASIDATLDSFDFLTDEEKTFLIQFKDRLINKSKELFPEA